MIELLTALLSATIIVGGMLLTLAFLFAAFAILPLPPHQKKRKPRHGDHPRKHPR